jgi:FHS family L-fucose permease-like MFS transporter
MVIGLVILVWAVLIWRVKFPAETESGTHDKMDPNKKSSHGHFSKLFKYPHFIKGVIAQFFYVGAQVGTWSYLIPYVKDFLNKPEKEAGYFLFVSLLAFGVGRFISTALMRKFDPNKLMGFYSIINIMLVAIAVVLPHTLGSYTLVISSFFMSLMFPTIFASGVKGLGPNTKIGGSMIIMAIIGGAIWTPIMGLISDYTDSLAWAMIVPLLAYIYVMYYAFKGSKPSGPLFETDEKVIISH